MFSADFNRDGTIGNDEFFAAFKAGRLTFDSPGVKAKFLVTAEVKKFFQNGFTGLGRDDAVFLFAQERAVFITAGTWDAQSLKEQAGGRFDIRLTDFPLPSRDDPEFGPLILGPKYDAGNTGFPFGLYRFSKQPELAREFLLFLSSFEGNRKLNSIIGWPPAIRGLPMPEVLEGFNPQNQGMYSCFNFNLGGETYVRWMQNYSLFKSDPTFTYQDLARDFGPFYLEKGLKDWREQQRDWRRAILRNERFLAGSRGSAIMEAPADPLNTAWVKYRAYTTARQVTPEITRATQVRMVTSGPARQVGPYDYLPEARQRILEDAAKTPPATNPVKPAGESATSGETQQQPKNNPSGAPERSGRAAQ